jgi:sRNA-binding carbon storage regulator CsrA
MLVLTRCPSESILIGEDTEVTVLEVSDGRVRLRITSSRLDPPVREETLVFDDSVRVEESVQVRVVSLRPEGGRVRLGVTAPREIPVSRPKVERFPEGDRRIL